MAEDMCGTLSQLVNRRANLKTHHIRLKNQLHEQVCVAYPSYKQFFQDIGRPTALYFWEHYPSPRLPRGKTIEDLAEELIPVSHNQLEEVDKALADFLPRFGCTLNTIPGVSDTTVVKLLSEMGAFVDSLTLTN